MKRIVIIEDDPTIRDIMTNMLETAGYAVKIYSDGSDYMSDVCELPDLYLIDKQLPDIDGLNICRSIKAGEATSTIPVIMVSANPDITRLAEDAKADDSLEKPFTMNDLLETVAKAFGREIRSIK